jgi:pentose-5-phosphate-3-epimerase
VSVEELAAIRRAAPTARIDVHLIVLGQSVRAGRLAAERRAIAAAVGVGAEFITLGTQHLSLHADELVSARAAGTDLWLEVPPDQPGTGALDLGVDGVLVMLIEPGTRQTADPAHLKKVERLAPSLPVAVDGGVTGTIATRSRLAGARYIISGRALLSVTPATPGHHRERLTPHGTP